MKQIKRILSCLLAACLALAFTPAASLAEEFEPTGTVVTEVGKIENAFGKADTKSLSELKISADIMLTGDVTITEKGAYRIGGTADNATVYVRDETNSGNITLILDDLEVTNNEMPVIVIEAADKVILWISGDCALTYTGGDSPYGAAIYARDDLTVTGDGRLTITSSQDGIDCKDDFKQTGADVSITADGAGLDANDSVRIGGGSLDIVSGKDGIHLDNDKLDSWFYLEDGAVAIAAGQDGIDVGGGEEGFTGSVTLYGGTLAISAGTDAKNVWSGTTSTKGIRCGGDIYIGAVTLDIASADDALHSAASLSITAGTLTLASGDDGIHADSVLSISGGSVLVSQSYEGLEAYEVRISGGETRVYASDDGVNAAGGSDTSSAEANPWARWNMGGSSTGALRISGSTLYVNAAGDGLDSNGSIYVTGGLTIVEGPEDNGNGALDKGDGTGCVASITGGTVLALGSTGMAVNFDSGTQCSALVALSGSAGNVITVDDGSGFTLTAGKAFSCAVYSSPLLAEGQTYTLTAGSASAALDFTESLYYSDVSGFFGNGFPGGFGGGRPGGFGGFDGRP